MIPFFLPKIKQKKNKKKGKLIDPKTGLAFLGPFLLDHLGNFFKGKTLTKDSEPLVFDPDEKEDIDSSLSFFDRFPEPSDKDYTKGKLKRFFVKDIPSNKVRISFILDNLPSYSKIYGFSKSATIFSVFVTK